MQHRREAVCWWWPPLRTFAISDGILGTRACLGVRLRDLVQGPFRWALLSNYMIDTRWLLSAVPALLRPDLRLLIVHGEREARYPPSFRQGRDPLYAYHAYGPSPND